MSLVATTGKRGDVSYVMVDNKSNIEISVVLANQTHELTTQTWKQAHQWINKFIEKDRSYETDGDY